VYGCAAARARKNRVFQFASAMPDKQIIEQLIADVGRLLGTTPAVPDAQRDAWLLILDDETMFDIEYDARSDRLVLAGGVRHVADVDREAVYEMLLQFNYLWTDTGGARMALDGCPGQVVMLHEMRAEGMGTTALCNVVEGLARMLRSWQEIIEAMAHGNTRASPAADRGLRDASARLAAAD
jgi:hypothetical protein